MTTLTAYLAEANISQARLSETLGISRSHLSLIASGERKPSLELAFAIERATGGAVPASSWIPLADPSPLPPPNEAA